MYLRSLLNDPQIWKLFQYIENLQEVKSLRSILNELSLEISCYKRLKKVFAEVGILLKIEERESKFGEPEFFVHPLSKSLNSQMNIELSDYLALQAFYQGTNTEALRERVLDFLRRMEFNMIKSEEQSNINLENALNHLDSISSLEDEEGVLNFQNPSFSKDLNFSLKDLEKAIEEKICVSLNLLEGQQVEFFPHRIIIQNSEMTLIGEDKIDHCIGFLNLETVESLEIKETGYKARFSQHEINHFIVGLRSINENNVRLVLKVLNENIDLNPSFQFVEKPYVATNWEGHRIWGATLEYNEELIHWLASVSEHTEILDPENLRMEVRRVLTKANTKKAA